jgi:hypothetical protein
MPVAQERIGRRLAALAAMAASAVGLSGCYGYIAPARGSSLVGSEARLQLSDSGAVVLASKIGPSAESITGRVVVDSASSYILALSSVKRRDGDETLWRGERIIVDRALVADAGARRFSPSRTALFSGLLSAGLVAAKLAFQGHGSGGGGGGVGGSQPH